MTACLYFPTVQETLLKEVTWQLTFHENAIFPIFFSFGAQEAIRHSVPLSSLAQEHFNISTHKKRERMVQKIEEC